MSTYTLSRHLVYIISVCLLAGCAQPSTPTATALPAPTIEIATPTPEVPTATPAPVPVASPEPIELEFELVAEGFLEPNLLVSPPDETQRRFIVDQMGTIHILTPQGTLLAEPFLDIRDRLDPNRTGLPIDFRGLVGFAFHPEFASNGRFVVFYTTHPDAAAGNENGYTSVVAEFRVSTDDPNRAALDSERIILQIDQPDPAAFAGGPLVFGPQDGYLYIAVGNADRVASENSESLFGKVLRVDIDNGEPYAIPPDNPFLDSPMPDEVYALGLRNGFRLSADSTRGEVYLADERFTFGWSEVDVVSSGAHFGWPVQLGRRCFSDEPTEMLDTCLTGIGGETLAPPVVEYSSAFGVVIGGAIIYRGNAMPDLQGKLIVADSGITSGGGGHQGKLLVASPQPAGAVWMWPFTELEVTVPIETARFFWSMGQDAEGEVYVLTVQRLGGSPTSEGKVFKLVPAR